MEYSTESQVSGTIYGVALNDRRMLDRMAGQFDSAPYKAPPKAPILYIKPRNTFAAEGAQVRVPAEPGVVRIDATVGVVIGRQATRVSADKALEHVRGYMIVSDVTLPHDNYYRPAVAQRCRDGFCPMGQEIPAGEFDLDQAALTVFADEAPVYQGDFKHLVRGLPELLEDVTEFMTLDEGDVLLVGHPEGAPVVRPGQKVRIEVAGLGALSHEVVKEEDAQ